METFLGILIPFLGTTLGAACVFFLKKSLGDLVQRSLAGFAAGVMVAASIWSLLIPAIEQSEGMGKLSFLPAFSIKCVTPIDKPNLRGYNIPVVCTAGISGGIGNGTNGNPEEDP